MFCSKVVTQLRPAANPWHPKLLILKAAAAAACNSSINFIYKNIKNIYANKKSLAKMPAAGAAGAAEPSNQQLTGGEYAPQKLHGGAAEAPRKRRGSQP